ncbi:MAG: hypothetical protein IPK26_06530 [Planctomycetes bacterium]|nr:hypothetical protein [Planctomycetota bacterium]
MMQADQITQSSSQRLQKRAQALKWTFRLVSITFLALGVYRHGLTPEWEMRSNDDAGMVLHVHSWFWQPPVVSGWAPVGIGWWRSLLLGGGLVFTGLLGWRLAKLLPPAMVQTRSPVPPMGPSVRRR